MLRGKLSLSMAVPTAISLIALFVALGGPGYAAGGVHAVFAKKAVTADKLDGFHASKKAKPNTILPLDKNGKLPSSVLAATQGPKGDQGPAGLQGPKGDKGDKGAVGTGNASGAGAFENGPESLVLAQYGQWTDVATTTLTTTKESSKLLVLGQFTAQTGYNEGDLFLQLLVDGAVKDGLHWASLGHSSPATGNGRAELFGSAVVTVPAGTHTVTLQGSYYDGAKTITVRAYARRVIAAELG
jgi:hypothetical protein